MTELLRDTAFGRIVRIISGKRFFAYAEERNPELWKKYVNEEKSGRMAHHGTTEPHGEDSDTEDRPIHGLGGVRTRENGMTEPIDPNAEKQRADSVPESQSSSKTRVDPGAEYNEASGVKIDPEKGRDKNIIDWYGPDDPENPVNWSQFKKFFVTFEICLLTFAVYIGSAIYTAGLEGVVAQFGVSRVVAVLGLTLFVVGYGVGPMLWSPMSEIPQIGRNPIYIGTLLVFVLFQLPVGYASNIGMLLAFRFLTGFIGSPCLATGGASLSDIYPPKKRAYAISIWGIAAICGPVLGPLVGGFAAESKGWQWTIWELTWLSGFAWVVLFFFLPETSANNILYRRTRRLRKLTGNDKLISEPELMGEKMSPKDIALMTLVRPFTLSIQEPIALFLNIYIALIYALLYCWFESFPIVFEEMYGFSLGLEGVAFVGILVGAFIIIPPFFWYLHKYVEPQFNENGELKPEERLPPAMVGAFFIPICLFWFGWSAGHVHWIMPIIGSSFFSMGAFLLFNSVLNYLPDAYPEYAASLLAGNDLFRSCVGAAFPLFATQMYEYLGVGWASSLLGFLSIVFIPIPFVLYKYGEKIRMHSKRARHDL